MLFSFLCPWDRAESIYAWDFETAAKNGLEAVILDIDNTMVPHDAPADERSIEFVKKLKGLGLKAVIVSNNHGPRAESFAKAVGLPVVFDAGKPGTKGYREAVKRMQVPESKVLCVGDQLFTDIWGANNAGLRSLQTEPLDPSTDTLWIRVKRVLEKPIKLLHKGKRTSRIAQD